MKLQDIPTASKLYEQVYPSLSPEEAMIEFAKLHVTRALYLASKEAPGDREDEIKNCYPPENIK